MLKVPGVGKKKVKEIDIDVTPKMQDNWDDDESEWDENQVLIIVYCYCR